MSIDYADVLAESLGSLAELNRRRDALDAEEAKLRQFIQATLPLLPDGRRDEFLTLLQTETQRRTAQAETLTAAVRNALREHGRDWLTVAQVRDRVAADGFDFSAYMSNPLASVSTTLKRLSEKERAIKTIVLEGVTAYRWRVFPRVRRRITFQEALDTLRPAGLPDSSKPDPVGAQLGSKKP